MAQSAISRKVKLLEDELGEKLFRRVNKKVFLTPAGKVMLRYSDRIFQELRNASLEIADLRELNQGVLRIGSGMTACMYLLPPVIEKFQKRFPKVDIQVQTGPAEVILPKVRDGALDIGVVTLAGQLSGPGRLAVAPVKKWCLLPALEIGNWRIAELFAPRNSQACG